MKCESCREREATVHYTMIEGSEKKEIHLCEECYRQKAASRPPIEEVSDIAELFSAKEYGTLYGCFTDRARKVMAYAHQEAHRFNHDCIGPEHILLGLIREGTGLAAAVVRNLGVDVQKVRLDIEKMMRRSPNAQTQRLPPFTPLAKKVIGFSLEEARALGHTYFGTEHILLGLLRDNEGTAGSVLKNHGVKIEAAREEVLRVLRNEPLPGSVTEASEFEKSQEARTQSEPATWPFTENAVEMLALALDEARKFGQDRAGIEHVLLALLKRAPDNLTLALRELHVEPKALYDKIVLKLAAGKKPAGQENQTGDRE